MTAPIVLLTDFGLADHYAGVLHAVLERDAPGVSRIDLCHDIPPGDVWGAAFRLGCAWPWLPEPCVVLSVVDPGVGTGRRAVAARHGSRWVVTPDTGLGALSGAPDEAVELRAGMMGLPDPSRTFHGRDLFAPAAARLARGEAPDAVGDPVDPTGVSGSPLPTAERIPSGWQATVVHVDRFGNLSLNVPAAEVPEGARVRVGDGVVDRRVTTYGEGPSRQVVLLEGSARHLELAVNGGSAAEATGLDRGDVVEVVLP